MNKEVVKKSNFYLVEGHEYVQFRGTKKSLLKLFDNSKRLKKYLQENKLNLRKITDLNQIFAYAYSVK